MSLHISLYEDEDHVASLNWLRNPFGLEQWAEDNTMIGMFRPITLYDVINTWSYSDSKYVDRPLFLETVLYYWQHIKQLERGYFHFTLPTADMFACESTLKSRIPFVINHL
jgi:hypothetical protein